MKLKKKKFFFYSGIYWNIKQNKVIVLYTNKKIIFFENKNMISFYQIIKNHL